MDSRPPPPLVSGHTGSSVIGVQVQLRGPEPSLSWACAARLACFILVFNSAGTVYTCPCLFTLTATASGTTVDRSALSESFWRRREAPPVQGRVQLPKSFPSEDPCSEGACRREGLFDVSLMPLVQPALPVTSQYLFLSL